MNKLTEQAEMIRAALNNPNHFYASNCDSEYAKGVKSVATALAMFHIKNNPHFDRDRFLKACGVMHFKKEQR